MSSAGSSAAASVRRLGRSRSSRPPPPTGKADWPQRRTSTTRARPCSRRCTSNTFGIGAPLAGLPVYAVLDLFVDIEHDRFWWWHGAALTASLLTALAALFVFLAARGFVQPMPAALIALAFGLGSCAWPVSSQALWQHPASTFFLSLGAWLLLRSAPSGRERRPLDCRLVRGGARHGGAVPPHRRGGGAVHGSISAVRGPPPVQPPSCSAGCHSWCS